MTYSDSLRTALVAAIRKRQAELRHLRRLRMVVERMDTDGLAPLLSELATLSKRSIASTDQSEASEKNE